MELDAWYKVVTPRKEVREGRSFNPDEFAIALEQVVAGTAPHDYVKPNLFFARTFFTRALTEYTTMVLKRLAGETANTAPVLTLITQFGGGKTHTLTTLFHLAKNPDQAKRFAGIGNLLQDAGLPSIPKTKVAVFVGNAWDPQKGRETPWIDIARQLAGDEGVSLLGMNANTTPPGTEAIGRIVEAAGGSALILFDEVLNFMNRHRPMAEPFYAFIQNLTVAMTGQSRSAMVVSLPRSQVEMTEYDIQWQDKITKIVRRVAKDLISNDEAEISEVVRRRLFDDLEGERIERVQKKVARAYADWCFERRAQLPSEWTYVDTARVEAKARELLQKRFEACYPFHPATLSVFQRKWNALPQYQQTRGTLAMLAQWISLAYREGFTRARREPLITLGSAPLEISDFLSVILGQLGESKLSAAISADIASDNSHARALDADTKGALRDIHRRVGSAILFESSGGQADKVAHLPELRFALGEPDLDTTSIDTAAITLEGKSYFIRKVGTDGYKIYHKPTLKKVVNDRRASLDSQQEILPALKNLVRAEFEKGRTVPLVYFPVDNSAISDSPKLTLVLVDPTEEWNGGKHVRDKIAEWTKTRGSSARLYAGALVWIVKKPGRDLYENVETWLAWKRVKRDIDDGTLGGEFEKSELAEVQDNIRETERDAQDEVWASYRFVVLADASEKEGLKPIDLGAGHASAGETLCGRIIAALKSNALLNESPGAGYLDRKWPPAFKESGAWPLISLRQAFLTGALDRLLDPDAYLRTRIPEFVSNGEFGLASGQRADGTFERVWFKEPVTPDEITFDADIFLLKKGKAQDQKSGAIAPSKVEPKDESVPPITPETDTTTRVEPSATPLLQLQQLHLFGDVPPETWNRLGTKLIPKLRAGKDLKVEVGFTLTVSADASRNLVQESKQILEDLGVADKVKIDVQ